MSNSTWRRMVGNSCRAQGPRGLVLRTDTAQWVRFEINQEHVYWETVGIGKFQVGQEAFGEVTSDRFWLRSPIFTGWISSSTSKALYCAMWLLLFLPTSPVWTSGDISLNRGDVVSRETPKVVLCWLKLFVWRPWALFFTRQVTCLHRQHGWYRTKISPPSSWVAAFKRSRTMHKGAQPRHMLRFKTRLNLIKATDNGSLHHTGQNDFSYERPESDIEPMTQSLGIWRAHRQRQNGKAKHAARSHVEQKQGVGIMCALNLLFFFFNQAHI